MMSVHPRTNGQRRAVDYFFRDRERGGQACGNRDDDGLAPHQCHALEPCARMAKEVKLTDTSVQRISHEAKFMQHGVHSFKVSNDPKYDEKVSDVVGL
jgi:hypothetical protein